MIVAAPVESSSCALHALVLSAATGALEPISERTTAAEQFSTNDTAPVAIERVREMSLRLAGDTLDSKRSWEPVLGSAG